jgi:NADH-quinone oxidoreductase subunit A
LALAAVILVGGFFLLSQWLGPRNMTPGKAVPYESGMPTDGARHTQQSARFFLTAILFVVFDIEAVFIFPWAARFRELGWYGLVEMGLFIGVLGATLVYAIKKGAFEWNR